LSTPEVVESPEVPVPAIMLILDNNAPAGDPL
jgi:hypothetical protein